MATSAKVRPSSADARRRMQSVRQKNTSAESALRRELHARGLRYRIHVSVLTKPRRVADVAFSGLRVAVFVDGCFWHGCPEHASWPSHNAELWKKKIDDNRARDAETTQRLVQAGWRVVRIWEHEQPGDAADRVEAELARGR